MYRFRDINTVHKVMYEGKTDDYGNQYTEELLVLTFEDEEEKEIEFAFGENDLRWIVDKIKNVI